MERVEILAQSQRMEGEYVLSRVPWFPSPQQALFTTCTQESVHEDEKVRHYMVRILLEWIEFTFFYWFVFRNWLH